MDFVPFIVRCSDTEVQGWAPVPLPFEPKGRMLAYRQALRSALAGLAPAQGRVLVGRYASTDTRRCDVENLLVYNVGASAFAHLNLNEVVLVRAATPVPPPGGAPEELVHHHRYVLQAAPPPGPGGRLLARFGPAPLRTPVKVETVWLDVRENGVVATGGTALDRLAVEVTIHRPIGRSQPVMLGMVKVVVDGVVSALHTHDGMDMEVVAARLSARLGVPPSRIADLLGSNPAGVLGRRRLLWPFRTFVQWNPADDAIEWLRVRTVASSSWQLSGTIIELDAT